MTKTATKKKTTVPKAPPEAMPEAKPIADTIVEEEVVLELVKATPVIMSRTGLEVEHNTVHRVNVSKEITPEQCLDEKFWCHIAGRFDIGDTIVVRPDTMEWELVLHVASKGRDYAQVIKKVFYDLSADLVQRPELGRYSVDFGGTTYKHRALLDGEVLKDGFATKALAIKACENHQMAVDRGPKS